MQLTTFRQQLREKLQPVCASEAQVAAEADLILECVLGFPPAVVYTEPNHIVSDSRRRLLSAFLDDRIGKRIPVQYLLHQAWFYGLRFYVNPHVLIPRPETELLVDKALETATPGARILDVGVGSGAIAVALAHVLGDDAFVTGVDLSREALRVARINAARLNVRLDLRPPGDLFEPVAGEQFDMIISNPPYVDPALRPDLMPEVLWHEPGMALFPPENQPYYFYERLAREGAAHVAPGGMLILETGAGMTSDVAQILMTSGYRDVCIFRDYAGRDRIVTARQGKPTA